MTKRLQLFPVIIVTALVIVGVKVNDFVRNNEVSFASINVAVAQEKKAETTKGDKVAEKEGKKKKGEEEVVEQEITNLSKSEIALLEALSTRRKELDKREKDLNLRLNLLNAAEKRIDEKILKT